MRLSNEEVTLTLNPDQAMLIAAALHVFGWLAGGGEDDPDTALTEETYDTYLSVMRQMYGGDEWHSGASSTEIKALAQQLERDMLSIVHRNYQHTAEGLKRK